jgi:hypothetical protein
MKIQTKSNCVFVPNSEIIQERRTSRLEMLKTAEHQGNQKDRLEGVWLLMQSQE